MNKSLLTVGACVALAGAVGAVTAIRTLQPEPVIVTSTAPDENTLTFNVPDDSGHFYITAGSENPGTGSCKTYKELAADGKPGLLVQFTAGNMSKTTHNDSPALKVYLTNANGSLPTINLIDGDGWYISNVSFTMTKAPDATAYGTYRLNGTTTDYTATDEGTPFSWEAPDFSTTFPGLTAVNWGTGKIVVLSDFTVTVKRKYELHTYDLDGTDAVFRVTAGGIGTTEIWYKTVEIPATAARPGVKMSLKAGNMSRKAQTDGTYRIYIANTASNQNGNIESFSVLKADGDDKNYYIKRVSFTMTHYVTTNSTDSLTMRLAGTDYASSAEGTPVMWEAASEDDVWPGMTFVSGKQMYMDNPVVVVAQRTTDFNLDDPELEAGDDGKIAVLDASGTSAIGTTASTQYFASITMDAAGDVPGVTLATSNAMNNMWRNGDNICIAGGLTQNSTYVIESTDPAWYVAGFSYRLKRANGGSDITVSSNGRQVQSSIDNWRFTVDGFTEEQGCSFTVTGANVGGELSEFNVLLRPATHTATNVMATGLTGVPYRIPAIACTGVSKRLVALADYRHCKADIGGGRIDLHVAVSDDNGATWSEPGDMLNADGEPVAQGTGVAHTLSCGFGDPAVVADRESDRLFAISCAGSTGFFGATMEEHQYMTTWTSEDGGTTWSDVVDKTEQLYGLFSGLEAPVKSMFFGSGRIMQSSRVKVGDYYRIYGVISGRTTADVIKNWVLYSDDFGGTWAVLGDVEDAPVPSAGDEPKCEELPDGSIVVSARRNGATGRNFNIFRYTDIAAGHGTWDGLVATQLRGIANNACNGEILITPAKNAATGELTFIVLQSIPFSNSRQNVGIVWKVLGSAETIESTSAIASGWDGQIQLTQKTSAYSTMVLDGNGNVAFLFEENSRNAGYNIAFKSLTIEQITDSAYTAVAEGDDMKAVADAMRDAVVADLKASVDHVPDGVNVRKPFDDAVAAYEAEPSDDAYAAVRAALAALESVADSFRPAVGRMTAVSLLAEQEALAAYEADPSELNAKHLANVRTYAQRYVAMAGQAYRLNNALYPEKWLSTNGVTLTNTLDAAEANAAFTLEAAEEAGKFTILNEATGKHVGTMPYAFNAPWFMTELADSIQTFAIEQYIVNDTPWQVFVADCSFETSYKSPHSSNGMIVRWMASSTASQWLMVPETPDECLSQPFMTADMEDMTISVLGSVDMPLPHEDAIMALVHDDETAPVATVTDGKIVGLRAGTARITATLGHETKECTLTVTPLVLAAEPETVTLKEYETATVKLYNSENGAALGAEALEQVTWSSSDASVASVEAGTIHAVAPGTAVISGTYDGQTVTVDVTVTDLFTLGLKVSDLELAAGYSVQAEYTAVTGEIPETLVPAWSSSDNGVATVDDNGVVTGVDEGTAVITVSIGNHSAAAEVKVFRLTTGLALSIHSMSAMPGCTFFVEALVDGNPTYPALTWSLDNDGAMMADTDKANVKRLVTLTPGTTMLTVATTDSSNLQTQCAIHVSLEAGIDGITVDGERAEVYDLKGVRLERNLSELSAGVYILRAGKVSIKLHHVR